MLGAGVNVTVGGNVAVAGGIGLLGIRVSVGGWAIVGVGREANGTQLVKHNNRIKIQILLTILKLILPNFYRGRFYEWKTMARQSPHKREIPPTLAAEGGQGHRLRWLQYR